MTTQPLSALTMLLSRHTRRREFITLLGGGAAWPLAARAQQERARRIGMLVYLVAGDAEGQARLAAFTQALSQLGWSEGRNLRIESRWANAGDVHRHAAELVALTPEVLLAATGTATRGTVAAGDENHSDRVRECYRSGRFWFRREPGTSGRQRDRIHHLRIQHEREMAGAAQGDRARRDASGGASRSGRRFGNRAVRRGADRRAGIGRAVDSGRRARSRRDRARP